MTKSPHRAHEAHGGRSPSVRDHLLLGAFVLSGAAALGYELLWTRLLALALGSEILGMLGTMAGFFAGLALGSAALHARVRRSRDPARLFAGLEIFAAAFALASPYVLYGLARHLPPLIGPAAADNDHFLGLVLALAIATVTLLPGTFPMGATLAALVEARRRAFVDGDERGLGRLYAANTAGATLGVLASVFLLLPRLGFVAGSIVLSSLGMAAAALALAWSRQQRSITAAPPPAGERHRRSHNLPLTYTTLLLTGLAGVGLQVVGVQVLAQNMEDTVYTFACALAVYLVGTSAGAWIYGLLAPRLSTRPREEVTAALLLLQIVTVSIAALVLSASRGLLGLLTPSASSYVRGVMAEVAVASAVFLVPTLIMGALFSHLMASIAGHGAGRAYAVNTLGSMAAPVVFGLGAIGWLGYAPAIFLVAGIYAALLATLLWHQGWLARPRRLATAGVALASLALVPRTLVLVEVPEGWKTLFRRPSLHGLVMVTEENESQLPGRGLSRRLQVNRHFRMGGAASFGERRMGHLPLLLAPEARSALFLGVGTGATLSAVRHFPLERVDAVELVPEVLASLPLFEHVNEAVASDPRVRFHRADARRFVAASRDRYDVVIADLFHPARDGAGSLYAREHFRVVAEKLTAEGLFCQWLPLYQFDLDNLKTVIRTFVDVFPTTHSFLGIYNVETPALALLGRRAPERPAVTVDQLEAQLASPVYRGLLMDDVRDLLGAYMLDRESLLAFAGSGPLNTDLDPRVLFRAPQSAYEKREDLKWESLQALLERKAGPPEDLIGIGPDRASLLSEARLFSEALRHYLQGELVRVESELAAAVPEAAIEKYLTAYETAPTFAPAAGILYNLAAIDTSRTEAILERMLLHNPAAERTHRAYLRFLAFQGDVEKYERALATARAQFGTHFRG